MTIAVMRTMFGASLREAVRDEMALTDQRMPSSFVFVSLGNVRPNTPAT